MKLLFVSLIFVILFAQGYTLSVAREAPKGTVKDGVEQPVEKAEKSPDLVQDLKTRRRDTEYTVKSPAVVSRDVVLRKISKRCDYNVYLETYDCSYDY